ncbi:NAD(P)H-dependent nitrite reductase catalytic subunit [Humitalea rosea]|uniref:NAD(P)H-dependent nitrite reductase catalytic subunit n=1 Tax=Humitalea rosea TaxID=990373 RepID=A0A2W7IWG6_9PROT|nr:NirA family protein [Humitalea rosea]PZW43033.1 NAD(P)H-dependent nitrite reductase catalytic subunit [Humitalea rosea]
MNDQAFNPEQAEYLKGFFAGVEARRGTLLPDAPASGAPPDALRAAQDAAIAAGGTLTAEEEAKREKHPLDRWDEVSARAAKGVFPKGTDVLMTKFHGLFYVAPAQDSFMCRLRIPGGIMNAYQLRGVAAIADDCGGGYMDVTTRANLQIREIPAAKGPEVVMRLGDIGLLPRGTGADNIRNITAGPTAGIDPDEWVDPRPHVRALHHHILATRDLYALPRKFNIAFEGGGAVAVLEDTNDIAFTAARLADGTPVWRVALGGITGHRDFAKSAGVVIPLQDCVPVADAMLRVFIAHGDRTDRRRARLKYLLDAWGVERFLAETETLLGHPMTRVPDAALSFPPSAQKHAHLGIGAQRQPGRVWIGATTPVGRLTTEAWREVARIADTLGDGDIRLTVWQTFLLSGIAEERAAEAVAALAAIGCATGASAVRGGLVACTGNAGCKFAASNTKRHAAELADWLDARIVAPGPVNIHLTGCHHSCAQHLVADIGLLGAKIERGDETIEGYDLHVGGGAGPEQKIGRLIVPQVAAEDLGPAVQALLLAWAETAPGENFQSFCAAHDDDTLRRLVTA